MCEDREPESVVEIEPGTKGACILTLPFTRDRTEVRKGERTGRRRWGGGGHTTCGRYDFHRIAWHHVLPSSCNPSSSVARLTMEIKAGDAVSCASSDSLMYGLKMYDLITLIGHERTNAAKETHWSIVGVGEWVEGYTTIGCSGIEECEELWLED